MPIPTKKQIVNQKKTAMARAASLASREAKRKAEGRLPDGRSNRAARKEINAQKAVVLKNTRTDAQKKARSAKIEIDKLQTTIKELSEVDPDTLINALIDVSATPGGGREAGKYDLLKALELRDNEETQAEICRQVGCSVTKLKSMFLRYDTAHGKVLLFKEHRANILADLQRRMILSIKDSDIRRSGVADRVRALCTLYDKERLERDMSTSNIATIHDDIAAIKSRRPGLGTASAPKAIPVIETVTEADIL
jgi:hypothetical protein